MEMAMDMEMHMEMVICKAPNAANSHLHRTGFSHQMLGFWRFIHAPEVDEESTKRLREKLQEAHLRFRGDALGALGGP